MLSHQQFHFIKFILKREGEREKRCFKETQCNFSEFCESCVYG